jgi:hypothetical protein
MTPTTASVEVPSKRRLAMTTAIALAVAVLLLVTIVLPAEYGVDPLGTGRALGVNAISAPVSKAEAPPAGATMYKPVQVGPIGYYAAPYKIDSTEFRLGPYEYVEYKYRLEKGGGLLFSWTSTGDVIHDFHGQPEGGGSGSEESFDKKPRRDGNGVLTAPFSGIHGWYWENPGGGTIMVKITSAGFYSSATEFRFDRTRHPHELKAPVAGMANADARATVQ